jgi:hypothetical protein
MLVAKSLPKQYNGWKNAVGWTTDMYCLAAGE